MNLEEAKAVTDARYHHHIVDIKGKAYMTVAGRIAMAQDEHRVSGDRLSISTSFYQVGEVWVACARVESSLYGLYQDHSQVMFGGGGVDRTNPIENASTSAVGRALGLMGYGVFGAGIASAEEVEQAMAQQEAVDAAPTAESGEGKLSPRQIEFLSTLLIERGVDPEHCTNLIHGVCASMSKHQISESIGALAAIKGKLTSEWLRGRVSQLRHGTKITRDQLINYVETHFRGKKFEAFSAEEQEQLINWLKVAGDEEDDIPDAPAQAARLETVTGHHPDDVTAWMEYTQIGQDQLDKMDPADISLEVKNYIDARDAGVL